MYMQVQKIMFLQVVISGLEYNCIHPLIHLEVNVISHWTHGGSIKICLPLLLVSGTLLRCIFMIPMQIYMFIQEMITVDQNQKHLIMKITIQVGIRDSISGHKTIIRTLTMPK